MTEIPKNAKTTTDLCSQPPNYNSTSEINGADNGKNNHYNTNQNAADWMFMTTFVSLIYLIKFLIHSVGFMRIFHLSLIMVMIAIIPCLEVMGIRHQINDLDSVLHLELATSGIKVNRTFEILPVFTKSIDFKEMDTPPPFIPVII